MSFCKYCSRKINDDDACPHCGAPASWEMAQLKKNDLINVFEERNGWFKISKNGHWRYVSPEGSVKN